MEAPQSDFTETSMTADGHRSPSTQKLSNEGLAKSMSKLIATCPAPATSVQQQRVEARDQVAK
jgi:hypothetical protein